MSKPYWVSGPPGTGKTHIYIKKLYKEHLDKGVMWNRIVILSHTVNAAKEILKAKKNRGKWQGKSCVSWSIQGNKNENDKIIWEGEALSIDHSEEIEDE